MSFWLTSQPATAMALFSSLGSNELRRPFQRALIPCLWISEPGFESCVKCNSVWWRREQKGGYSLLGIKCTFSASANAREVRDGPSVPLGRLPAQAWQAYLRKLHPPGALPQSCSPGVSHRVHLAPHVNWKSSIGRSFSGPTISATASIIRPTIVFGMCKPRIARIGSTGRPRQSVGGSTG